MAYVEPALGMGAQALDKTRVLLIVGGGIPTCKAMALTRLLRKAGVRVRPVLTRAGAQSVTLLSLSALAAAKVYSDRFSLTDEAEVDQAQGRHPPAGARIAQLTWGS